ncbi:hypothetical protein ES703_79056 [subsurface metagenome]
MKKINIIKICAIIIAVCILFTTLTGIYYNLIYRIRDHNERETFCAIKGMAYFRAYQSSKETIECCYIEEGKLIYCEEFLG